MDKTNNTSSKSSEEILPKWAQDEIRSVQFREPEILTRTGYVLDIYTKDFKIDVQLYEALPDGRTIIEGLDVPKSMKITEFMKGTVYEFKIKMFRGQLSSKVVELLKTKFMLDMDSIYRFELQELQRMDVESDISYSSSNGLGDE
ncbi:MAG TPA: hypothetical protein VE622_03785 [Nitrososphaeraceae archaeon]|jgi:hypothetical protein|nr:hypothetical protein [Nitrososphaeraceae archaeon]